MSRLKHPKRRATLATQMRLATRDRSRVGTEPDAHNKAPAAVRSPHFREIVPDTKKRPNLRHPPAPPDPALADYALKIMRASHLSLLAALARLATIALSIPLDTLPSLVPRTRPYCSNAPHTVAGT